MRGIHLFFPGFADDFFLSTGVRERLFFEDLPMGHKVNENQAGGKRKLHQCDVVGEALDEKGGKHRQPDNSGSNKTGRPTIADEKAQS
jgi:hypothetical protein